ncbi:hypothetical protein I6E11_04720 [Bacteroides caecigallinarum]|uniref:hypothetical protein n=1 Tax=Bacteroides caecigallinarum TaxID=1411144 RepID=UPI001F249CD8|nr:hypothetical protein [Bacteroides caecigallinarum]MCF2593110.1 hypothetical protein [Bacteroides caecigallinarum]
MNRKTVNISSKRIEQKITFVTSILGIIIMNIIWIAGSKSMNEQPHTSITQNEKDATDSKDIIKSTLYVSYTQAKLDY